MRSPAIEFKRRHRGWALQLSNVGLINAFGAAYACREVRGDAPDLMQRLDVLSDEIDRRYSAGTITDDDWSTETR
jgi:hypothetical protein